MNIINHIGLVHCTHTILDAIATGFFWYNDVNGSTHILKLDKVRLQKIGSHTLVWNHDELFLSFVGEDTWDVHELLTAKGCNIVNTSFENDGFSEDDQWNPDPKTRYVGRIESIHKEYLIA